jgi:hypothetical protein
MGVIDYSSQPRRQPVLTAAQIAAGVLVLLCLAALFGFAWLRFEIGMEGTWLATHRNPPGASAWRNITDTNYGWSPVAVRDTSVRTPLFVIRQEQVRGPDGDALTRPRSSRVEYRPAFWIIFGVVVRALAVDVAFLLKRVRKK